MFTLLFTIVPWGTYHFPEQEMDILAVKEKKYGVEPIGNTIADVTIKYHEFPNVPVQPLDQIDYRKVYQRLVCIDHYY